jgi:excisionase family DNA binding protein|nr:MAG TPA: helix-turn-helix domain protein [Caudoviricetes sp.]
MTEKENKEEREAFLNDDTDRLLSLDEVAARMRTSRALVSALVEAGALPVLRFRRDRRVPKSVFNRFLTEHIGEDLYTLVNMKEEVQRCGDGS